MPCLKIIN